MKKFKWRYLLVLPVAVILFVLFVHGQGRTNSIDGPFGTLERAAGDVHYTKLAPTGERMEGGIYDPSVAYTPDG